jgi:hypothetical protein
MINGVIAQKLQHLDTVLTELRSLGCLVDNAILVDMVNRRLVDFESFRNEILAYLKRTRHED